MSDTAAGGISAGAGNEANLDKMIEHQKEMFNLSLKSEAAKAEHDVNMMIAQKIGDAARKA